MSVDTVCLDPQAEWCEVRSSLSISDADLSHPWALLHGYHFGDDWDDERPLAGDTEQMEPQ